MLSYKSPADQWNYQEILHDMRPSVLLELGTRFGGSTLFFSDVMRAVHGHRPYQILTVDIDRTDIDESVFSEPNVQVLTVEPQTHQARAHAQTHKRARAHTHTHTNTHTHTHTNTRTHEI